MTVERYTTELSGGAGSVTLLLEDIDLLTLSAPDREFIFGLIDALRRHRKPGPRAPVYWDAQSSGPGREIP